MDKTNSNAKATQEGYMARNAAAMSTETSKEKVKEPPKGYLEEIEIAKIVKNPRQHRRTFGEKSLLRLGTSIKRHGLGAPIQVCPVSLDPMSGDPTGYRIVAGERRFRAWEMLKIGEKIPALVLPIGTEAVDEESQLEEAERMYDENAQREDLNYIDDARAFDDVITKRLAVERKRGGTKVKEDFVLEMAEQRGLSSSEVWDRLGLLDAPDYLQDVLADESSPSTQLSRAQAYALCRYWKQLKKKAETDPKSKKGLAWIKKVTTYLDGTPPANSETAAAPDAAGGAEPTEEGAVLAQGDIDPAIWEALPRFCKAIDKKTADVKAAIKGYERIIGEAHVKFKKTVDHARQGEGRQRLTAAGIDALRKKLRDGGKEEDAPPTDAGAADGLDGQNASDDQPATKPVHSLANGTLTVHASRLAGADKAALVAARDALTGVLAQVNDALAARESGGEG